MVTGAGGAHHRDDLLDPGRVSRVPASLVSRHTPTPITSHRGRRPTTPSSIKQFNRHHVPPKDQEQRTTRHKHTILRRQRHRHRHRPTLDLGPPAWISIRAALLAGPNVILGKRMIEVERIDEKRFRIELDESDLVLLNNAINETLAVIDAWEFRARVGVDRAQAEDALVRINRALD
jgi:hypothetical protein